jgi:hypothetical protein
MIIREAISSDYKWMGQILKAAGVRITALHVSRCESFVCMYKDCIAGLFSIIRIQKYIYPVLIHFIVDTPYRNSSIAVYMVRAVKAFCRMRGWKRIIIDSSGIKRVDNFTRRKFNIIHERSGRKNHKYFVAEIL